MKPSASFIIIALVLVTGIVSFAWWNLRNTQPIPPTAATPSQANVQSLHQDGRDIRSEEVEYTPGFTGHLARPKQEGNFPGVVMVHEWWGLNDGIKHMADELAAQGYIVLAVDLYGKVATTPTEAQEAVKNLDQQQATENLRAATAYLRAQHATKIASLGWCFGGGQSLQLALSGEKLDATVIYYGQLTDDAQKLKAITWPILGIFGDKDTSVKPESVASFTKALEKDGIEHEIHLYPGVGHAFANPSGQNYAPKETKDAWEKTLDFLKRTTQ